MTYTTRDKRQRIAKRLRRAWYHGRVTIDEVADMVGRGKPTVAAWITGASLPPATMLEAIAEALKGSPRPAR